MKKCILLFVTVCYMGTLVLAQGSNPKTSKTSLYIGPQASLPVGNLAKTQSFGLGFNAQLLYSIAPNTSVGGRVGYTYLFGKSYKNSYGNDYMGGSYNYSTSGKYKGISDITISGTLQHNVS